MVKIVPEIEYLNSVLFHSRSHDFGWGMAMRVTHTANATCTCGDLSHITLFFFFFGIFFFLVFFVTHTLQECKTLPLS